MRLWIALTGISLVAGAVALPAAEYNPARTRPAITKEGAAQRVIVKLRPTSNLQIQSARTSQASVEALAASNVRRIESMAQRHGLALEGTRAISADMHVMTLKEAAGGSMAQTLQALRADSAVAFAEVDKWVYPHATPNDQFFAGQWFLQAPDLDERSAVNATGGWDVTTGSTGVVIAVLDTGVRFDHPDLARATNAGRLLEGHDFVSQDAPNNFFTANDGSSRDTDASDPGDWVTDADVAAPNNQCTEAGDSSWHGTRVSGVIGALSNNSTGVAGLTWSAWISPVRVIGKCGGFNSDVLAGMRWAAGLAVPGVPANPYPADIINVSLGGDGPCTQQDQDVVTEVTNAGTLLVISAGNGSNDPNNLGGLAVSSPANCVGAAGIAGLRHAGTKVGFSNLGPEIALSAPGGNCLTGATCVYSIDTTTNDGATTPTTSSYTDQINANVGTSFSAPIVSGIAGLMLAVNGNLRPAQLRARLREGTLAFPPASPALPQCQPGNSAAQLECNCTTTTCGAGMANAQGAVNAALRPIAAIAIPNTFGPGTPVTLQGNGSAGSCNRTISAYQWTVVSPTSNPPTITDSNLATASVNAPITGQYVIRLTVTDDQGRTDAADVTIRPSDFTTSAPASAGNTACPTPITIQQGTPVPGPNPNPPAPVPGGGGGGGGGGGALDLLTILFNIVVVIVAALLPRRRDRSADFAQRARPASSGAYFVQRPRMRSALSSQVFCARR